MARTTRSVFDAAGVSMTLGTMLVAYVALVGLTAALGAYQSVLLVRYRLEFTDGLRRRLYEAVAGAEWRHLLGLRQSDLLTALTVDVNWVGQGTLAIMNLGVALVVVVAQLTVALWISPAVTGLAALTGFCLAALVWPLVNRSRRLGRELVTHNRSVLASLTSFLDGLKLAKAHGLPPGHAISFDVAMRRSRSSQVDFSRASATATAVQLTATAVALAVLVEVAVGRLRMPVADLLVVAFIFIRVVPGLTSAQSSLQTAAQTLPAFDELAGIIDDCERAAEVADQPGSPLASGRPRPLRLATAIELDNVTFSYRRAGDTPVDVLRGLSLELPAFRTTALIGPSGAGKTTVADLVVGLLRPTSGRVTIDGEPLTGANVDRWRHAVAMVPQDPFLFHDTIRANLTWARADAGEAELWAALAMASVSDFVRSLPDQLDTVVGDRGARMSGGERQRIALARALLRQPQLLVLDEATNALDAHNENVVLDALATLHGRMTVLVIAHQNSTIRSADHVIAIADGRAVAPTAHTPQLDRTGGSP